TKLVVFKCSLILCAVIIVGKFWCRDLWDSFEQSAWQLPSELNVALTSFLEKNPKLAVGTDPVPVSVQALEQSAQLSGNLKAWLQGAQISVFPGGKGVMTWSHGTNEFSLPYQTRGKAVHVLFPNGNGSVFDMQNITP